MSADLVVGDKSAKKLRNLKRNMRGSRADQREDIPTVTVEPDSGLIGTQKKPQTANIDPRQHHSQKQIFYGNINNLSGKVSRTGLGGQSGPILSDTKSVATKAVL